MNPFIEKARYRLVPELDDGLLGLSESEWAWCAGLFDGEGTISISSQKYLCVTACVHMADRDIVERLNDLWPAKNGVRERKQQNPEWSMMWEWAISKRGYVQNFLGGIYPWLGVRRQARVEEAFLILRKVSPDIVELQAKRRVRNAELMRESELHRDDSKRRTHCLRGHVLSVGNVQLTHHSDGYVHRKCRRCQNEQRKLRQTIAAAQSGAV